MPYRIVFTMPGYNEPLYYSRDREITVDGKPGTQPEVTPNLSDAHSFSHPESARAYRDGLRTLYRDRKDIKITMQDVLGNVLFEHEYEPADTGELDSRERLWVSPDDLESQRLGFICRPCIRPGQGKVYGMSPLDVPSLFEHLGMIDTIYSRPEESPVDLVDRARRAWMALGLPVIGIPSPNEDRETAAETKQILQEYEQSKRPGNLRPGDRR